MDRNISQLSPQIVWNYFHQLTQIPRPSKHEEKVRAYLIEPAKNLGLDYTSTPIGNMVIRKKATDASPSRKKLVLQTHMDETVERRKGKRIVAKTYDAKDGGYNIISMAKKSTPLGPRAIGYYRKKFYYEDANQVNVLLDDKAKERHKGDR